MRWSNNTTLESADSLKEKRKVYAEHHLSAAFVYPISDFPNSSAAGRVFIREQIDEFLVSLSLVEASVRSHLMMFVSGILDIYVTKYNKR